MHKYYNVYYFIDNFNFKELSKINWKINIVYRNYKSSNNLEDLIKIKKFCRKLRFKLFISNNLKLALKMNLDGVYLPAFNKKLNYSNLNLKKNFKIIGSAHSVGEIKIKENQNCKDIFLSPIFKTDKHKYYLDVIRFNLLSKVTQKNIICLGGINSGTIRKISLTKSKGFASISWIKKNGLNKI